MQNAAIRLLKLRSQDIEAQARDIIFGQLRQVIASMRIEDINRDRDAFLESIQLSLEPELKKIGLVLINVNITDITDDSGYIEAIGRKAAADRHPAGGGRRRRAGEEGQRRRRAAEPREGDRSRGRPQGTRHRHQGSADKERVIQVAELEKEARVGQETAVFQSRTAQVAGAERDKRIKVAEANSLAVKGENEAQATIARANADPAGGSAPRPTSAARRASASPRRTC